MLSLPILPARTGSLAVELEVGYDYTRSTSNDAFYEYTNHAGGAAISLSY